MINQSKTNSFQLSEILWDLWCMVSVVGIWPRFVEPHIHATTHLTLRVLRLPKGLSGLKVLQLSDLHLHSAVPDFFLKRIIAKVKHLSPDIIVFTGDFICHSLVGDFHRLQRVLSSFNAPYGCYAVFGNHDYHDYVSTSKSGDYDVIDGDSSALIKGWRRLFTTTTLTKKITPRASRVPLHEELMSLLKQTPFKLLHNCTELVSVKGCMLNLCGLGEYTLGRFQPEMAFQNYDPRYPGIILTHNPDSVPFLKAYPGEIVLCGHTHGGQVNIPGLWKKFTLLENGHLKKGLLRVDNKWVYINRGIGSVMKFRWFSIPEILLLTLEASP